MRSTCSAGRVSLVASCIWHVVGLEWSMRRWCREQAGITHAVGAGVLIAALVILAAMGGLPVGKRTATR
jgi:hypothetical protein